MTTGSSELRFERSPCWCECRVLRGCEDHRPVAGVAAVEPGSFEHGAVHRDLGTVSSEAESRFAEPFEHSLEDETTRLCTLRADLRSIQHLVPDDGCMGVSTVGGLR